MTIKEDNIMLKVNTINENAVFVQEGNKTAWLPINFVKFDEEKENIIAMPTWLKESKGFEDVETNECLGLVAIFNETENKVIVRRMSKEQSESKRTAWVKKTYKKVLFAYKGFHFVIDMVDGIEQTGENTMVCIGSYVNGENVSMSEVFNKYIKKEKKEQIVKNIKQEIEKNKYEGKVNHKEYDTIKTCVEANIPVYLYGPAGSGKNFTLMEIAKDLNLDFYFTNSVQQEYKLTGFTDAGGNYHETEFYKAFTKGGLFFLDEMDASIPEVLVLLNAAIANGYFEFPNGKVFAHENFRVVAAGNTIGSGADELYTGRLVLDQATLDRFVSIEFNYDINIEMKLANGNADLVSFIESLRKRAENIGVRATFSYRCIMSVTKLEGKMELEKILKIAVFKGMDNDTINTLKMASTNKYFAAMNKMGA